MKHTQPEPPPQSDSPLFEFSAVIAVVLALMVMFKTQSAFWSVFTVLGWCILALSIAMIVEAIRGNKP